MKSIAKYEGEIGVPEIRGTPILFNGAKIGEIGWNRDTACYTAKIGNKIAVHEEDDKTLEELFRRVGIDIV